jgi:hypothetical protein
MAAGGGARSGLSLAQLSGEAFTVIRRQPFRLIMIFQYLLDCRALTTRANGEGGLACLRQAFWRPAARCSFAGP